MNPKSSSRQTLHQLSRYILIGLLTNFSGYVLYLSLTYFWGSPKLTMTVLYCTGALIGFLANRRFTFRHNGHIGAAGLRYLLVQGCGYLLNLFLLMFFVDSMGFSPSLVQGVAIVVVATFLFVMFRLFVFAPSRTGMERSDHEAMHQV